MFQAAPTIYARAPRHPRQPPHPAANIISDPAAGSRSEFEDRRARQFKRVPASGSSSRLDLASGPE
jgi:hypothetical protein